MIDENMLQLCFSRQFWSSISRADYIALRLGFITVSIISYRNKTVITSLHKKWVIVLHFFLFSGVIQNHDLPLTYDFHNYMLRSMDEEFRDIVGVRYLFFLQDNLVAFLI
jgi:mlo protein